MTNEQREALLAGKPTKEAIEAFCKIRWANYSNLVCPNLVQEQIEPAIQAAIDIILPLHSELVLEKAQNDLFAARARIAELEAENARAWEHAKKLADEANLGFEALEEIDEAWLQTGYHTNRGHLSLPEQIGSIVNDLNKANDDLAELELDVQS